MRQEKSKIFALILASFLGLGGASEFYLKKYTKGWAKLAIFCCIIFLSTYFSLRGLDQDLNNINTLVFFSALTMGTWVFITLCLGDFIRLWQLPQDTFDQLYNPQKLPANHSEIFILYYLYKEGHISWYEFKSRRDHILTS